MTRNEALQKIHGCEGGLIDKLEALGLLKFDTPMIDPVERVRRECLKEGFFYLAGNISSVLKQCGCKIVEDK